MTQLLILRRWEGVLKRFLFETRACLHIRTKKYQIAIYITCVTLHYITLHYIVMCYIKMCSIKLRMYYIYQGQKRCQYITLEIHVHKMSYLRTYMI